MSLCDSCVHAWHREIPTKEEIKQGVQPDNYPLCHAHEWLNGIKTDIYEAIGARAYPIRDAGITIDVTECVGYVSNGQEKPEGKLVALHGGKATVKESLTVNKESLTTGDSHE